MGRSNNNTSKIINIVKYSILFAVIGLIVGYFIFGVNPISQNYLNVLDLMGISHKNILVKSINDALFETVRQKILMCGGVGGIAGLLFGIIKK